MRTAAVGLEPLKPKGLVQFATECDQLKMRLIVAFDLRDGS